MLMLVTQALACSRKQDLLDVTVNRLQKAKDHGDIIRSKKYVVIINKCLAPI